MSTAWKRHTLILAPIVKAEIREVQNFLTEIKTVQSGETEAAVVLYL